MPSRVKREAWKRLKVGQMLLIAQSTHLVESLDNLVACMN